MNSRLFFFTFLLFTGGLLWNGCSKETQNAEETLRLSDRLTAIDFRTECPAITIPAGSTDALGAGSSRHLRRRHYLPRQRNAH